MLSSWAITRTGSPCLVSGTWAEIRHAVQMVDAPCEATFEMGRRSVIVLLLLTFGFKESHAIHGEIVFSIETDFWSYLIYLAHPKISVFVLAHPMISIQLVDS